MTIGRIPSVEGGIQPTIVDAKGDILTATAADTPAVLAVGNNGDTLVADSSTSTGLRWAADWNTGKNKIINGDFNINQRSFTTSTSYGYGFDRFINGVGGGTGTATFTTQTFTPGSAPVAGYEGRNYWRCVTTGQSASGTFSLLQQPIEDVRTLAGQTVTISFWARANTGTPKMFVELEQYFGSGGSTEFQTGSQITISTSWTRYSVTLSVPSISGKTIGTGSALSVLLWVSAGSTYNARTNSLGIQSNTFDIWGVQVEAGSVATPFTTATGTLAGELAACQRYYYRISATSAAPSTTYGFGLAATTTLAAPYIQFPVSMRVTPSSIDYSTLVLSDIAGANVTVTSAGVSTNRGGTQGVILDASVASGLTQYRPYFLVAPNNTASYLGFSAEL